MKVTEVTEENLERFYDEEKGEKILNIVSCKYEAERGYLSTSYKGVEELINSCYNPPSLLDCQLVALNELLGGQGVGYIPNYEEAYPNIRGVSYIDMANPYKITILYDHEKKKFYLSSFRIYLEKNTKRFFGSVKGGKE